MISIGLNFIQTATDRDRLNQSKKYEDFNADKVGIKYFVLNFIRNHIFNQFKHISFVFKSSSDLFSIVIN